MKLSKFLSYLFGVLGLCAAVAAVFLSFRSLEADPVLLTSPEEPRKVVSAVMEAVEDNDYEAVSSMFYGNPNLGVDRVAADRVGVLIWKEFIKSFSYELKGECYGTENGLAQDVTVRYMKISTMMPNLRTLSQNLLEQRVAEAEDVTQIYDENNEYREDFVMEVLYDAAQMAIEQDAETVELDITMDLVFSDDRWLVIPSAELLKAISGGILN